jgi:hypothetical protein
LHVGDRRRAKRELIGKDKRYVSRSATGQFKESDDVVLLKRDRQQKIKTKVKSGQGDRGDR